MSVYNNAAINVEISVDTERGSQAAEDGKSVSFNPEQFFFVPSDGGGNKSGMISATNILGHELSHAWLAQFRPNINNAFEGATKGDPEHDQFVLKIEKAISEASGGGSRAKYDNTLELEGKDGAMERLDARMKNNDETKKIPENIISVKKTKSQSGQYQNPSSNTVPQNCTDFKAKLEIAKKINNNK